MNRFFLKSAVLLISTFLSAPARANTQQPAGVTDSEPNSPAATAFRAAPAASHVLAFPVATKSVQAQKLVEVAFDQYENVLLDDSAASARKATEQDHNFALAYAVWSFAAHHNQPNPQAAQKAELLAANAAPEERLLVKFLVAVNAEAAELHLKIPRASTAPRSTELPPREVALACLPPAADAICF
jgi:hypothetical protein